MTLSKKKKATKEARRMDRRAEERSISLCPEYQNRVFPDGTPMDAEEAAVEFPRLDDATSPYAGEIDSGSDALVAYQGTKFWLSAVQVSVVKDEFRGTIADYLPENDEALAISQSIMFERRHVIRVRAVIAVDKRRELQALVQ